MRVIGVCEGITPFFFKVPVLSGGRFFILERLLLEAATVERFDVHFITLSLRLTMH